MRWDESPRFLLIASVASAVLSAALGLAAIWDHPGYNVAASALALLPAPLGYRAFARSTHRRLGRIQREHLILRLRELPAPIESAQVSVPVDETERLAQPVLDVCVEAVSPATRVYRSPVADA